MHRGHLLRGGGKGGRTGCCNHRTGGHGGRQRNRHCFRLGERENRQFQLNALVRTAGHLFQRGAKRIDGAYRFRLGEIFPRSVGSFLFGGSSRQQVGAAGQGAEHQIAVMPGQLHTKAAHIHALLAQGGNLLQGFHSVPRGNGITDLKQIFAVRHARHAAHQRFIHSVGNTGAGIQDRQCITHGAIGQAADQLGGVMVQLNVFLPGHIFQPTGNFIRRNALEVIALAAAEDSSRNLLHFRCGKDKDHMLRRFLHGFQQGIERRGRQHVHLVDDIYLILAHGRQIGGFIAQVADVIHAVVGGGINFRYIQNGALINAFADSTFTAGVRAGGIQAVDRFGKNFGAGGFAGAAGAGKQVGMANAPGGDLVLQGRYDGFLANNIRKLARTPLAVQRTVQCNHPL